MRQAILVLGWFLSIMIGSMTPIGAMAQEDTKDVVWLGWPVTGYPWELDPDILFPKDAGQFQALANQGIQIGLRADGVVIWRALTGKLPHSGSRSMIESTTPTPQ